MDTEISAPLIDELVWHLRSGRATVLTGAGMSTDSGIPDYRGPQGSLRTRKPVTITEFLRSEEDRRRYWARSCLGWPFMAARRPNGAHEVVARLQRRGVFGTIITQNVDGLHQAAGSTNVIELHGGLARVVCLECGTRSSREDLQTEMLRRNPEWLSQAAEIAPDGDAELPRHVTASFDVPPCPVCGGILKPDVVFFGENVPSPRVTAAFAAVAAGDTLLVLGSSLTVYSGYRFADRASRDGTAVAIVNQGPTRADGIAAVKLDASLTPTLERLETRLTGTTATALDPPVPPSAP